MLACVSKASWGCVVDQGGGDKTGAGQPPVCVQVMQVKEGGVGIYKTCRRNMHNNSGWEVQLSGLS